MVSLWGSKNSNEPARNGNDEEAEEDQRQLAPQEAAAGHSVKSARSGRSGNSERTPLLNARDHHQATQALTADDPDVEVSPYNLFVVRGLRNFSILLLFITFVWWAILFVSTFISIPGLGSRGDTWTQFSYASLTVLNLFISLSFFVTPSMGERIACLTISALLLVNSIMILAVTRLRYEESWVGVATVLWAALIYGWTVLCDRVVEWAKRSEEERLVGRQETRRTLMEWCSVFSAFTWLLLIIVAIILMTLTLLLRSVDSALEPWGQRYLIKNGNYRVHLACFGNSTEGQPKVLVEGGETSVEIFSEWVSEAQQEGKVGRFCIWDRPGFGWSDVAPSPRSAGMVADSLSEALLEAEEDGPWVLVSHGVGSIYSRVFASRHSTDIGGLLLVDGLNEDLFGRVANSKRGFYLWLKGIVSPLGIDRLLGWIFAGRDREDRIYGRSAWRTGKWIKAELQETLAGALTRNEIAAARAILPTDIALTVVTSGKRSKRDSEWEDAQRDLTTLTDNLLSWDVVKFAPHNVWENDEGKYVLKKRLGELLDKARM